LVLRFAAAPAIVDGVPLVEIQLFGVDNCSSVEDRS
jgi:hypothetical protein